MKPKLFLLTLIGLLAGSLAGFAQTTAPAGDSPTSAASVAATNDAALPPVGATNLAETASRAQPVVAVKDDFATNTPAPAAASSPAATGASAKPGTSIPLIVMDDVPLTDAIKNLARQAGLNYMLDPKVSFGQAGADGRAGPQPTVSVHWENVTAEQALNALLGNYNLQLVEDAKSKIARITVKDPAAPEPLITKVIQLKYTGPSNIVSAVQNTLVDKRSKVVTDIRTSQLVLVATEKEMAEVDQLVERLDTQTKQVLIEARLLETTMNPTTTKGVDWTGTLHAQNVTFGNGLMSGHSTTTIAGEPTTTTTALPGGRTVSSTTTPGSSVSTVLDSILGNGVAGLSANTASGLNPAIGFLNADGVRAVLSFLNTYGETKVISSPRTVTLDNQTATIEVGEMYPIINTTAGTANTTGGSQISYSNLTVRLEVTPRISANDFVNLRVKPSVVRLGTPVTSTVGGLQNSVDSFLTRTIDTSVMIPSGTSLVMGGLVQDEVIINNVKVPLLGDIPGLGYLFRSDSKSRNKSNLSVFITPTIVRDSDFQPTKSDFLKTPVPKTDSLEDDWSSWDSGKPKDWSKPKTNTVTVAKAEAKNETKAVAKAEETKAEAKPTQDEAFDDTLVQPNKSVSTTP